jgi:hypothetical protein
MNSIDRYIKKINEMSTQEKIIELASLTYKLYNIKSFAQQQFLKYCIRILVSKILKHQKFFIGQANYWLT